MSTQYIGREILLVSENKPLVQDLQTVLSREGFLVTNICEWGTLEDLLENKFFIIAIIDFDIKAKGDGLEILEMTKKLSPVTHVFMITAREDFKATVNAFRSGCEDVIHVRPEEILFLIESIKKSAARISHEKERDLLLKDMYTVHNNFFKRMLSLHIKLTETEEAQRYRDGVDDSELPPLDILIVDSESNLTQELTSSLNDSKGWNIKSVGWGSEGLDHGTSGKYKFVFVGKNLPDFPSSMVVSSISASSPETTIIVVESAGDGSFRLSSPDSEDVQISPVGDIISWLRDKRIDLAAKSTKKQHIKTFKAQNFDFLQKYSKIKSRVEKLFGELLKDESQGD
ncbi:MAG: response regulator [Deltaproteobacteria bacterium]|nr:response regulator [Deltaproteobacteria bacterium]